VAAWSSINDRFWGGRAARVMLALRQGEVQGERSPLPRFFVISPTICGPRPGLILPRPDPLSVTRQVPRNRTHQFDLDFAVTIIEAAWRTAFVTI